MKEVEVLSNCAVHFFFPFLLFLATGKECE